MCPIWSICPRCLENAWPIPPSSSVRRFLRWTQRSDSDIPSLQRLDISGIIDDGSDDADDVHGLLSTAYCQPCYLPKVTVLELAFLEDACFSLIILDGLISRPGADGLRFVHENPLSKSEANLLKELALSRARGATGGNSINPGSCQCATQGSWEHELTSEGILLDRTLCTKLLVS